MAAAVLLGALAVAQETPTFPTRAERVTVDVVVTDKDGLPITGLGPGDFVVKEDGAVQRVLEFEAVDVTAAAALEETAAPEPGIATNAPRPAPGRHFLLVFDDLNLLSSNTDRVREAVRSFLEVHLREGDRVTVAPTAADTLWTGGIPEDREDLLAFVATLRGRRIPDVSPQRISDVEAMRIHVDRDEDAVTHVVLRLEAYGLLGAGLGDDLEDVAGQRAAARTGMRPYAETLAADAYAKVRTRNLQTLASLEAAIRSLPDRRGRRAVVLASDGFIHDRTLEEFQRVRAAASRANAALYFLDARGLKAPDTTPPDMGAHPDPANLFQTMSRSLEYAARESEGAEALAADTGGFTIRGNDLAPGLGRLSRESRTFYLLGYEPANQRRDGRFRKIEVQVRRAGAVVRSRKGYHAGPPRSDEEAGPAAGTMASLHGAIGAADVPLRLAAYVLRDAGEGRATVVLSAEGDPAAITLAEKKGRLVGAIDTFSSVTSRDTGQAGTRQRAFDLELLPEVRRRMTRTWVPMSHAFELPPGRYQATFVARDRGSARVGSVRHQFDVPDLRALRITTPVLSDTLVPGKDPDAPGSPAPLARRTFAAGTRLFCRFEVARGRRDPDRPPSVLVRHEIRRRDGTVVARTEPVPLVPAADGALASVFTLSLNRPGDYEIRLWARDEASGEEASTGESLTVEAPPSS